MGSSHHTHILLLVLSPPPPPPPPSTTTPALRRVSALAYELVLPAIRHCSVLACSAFTMSTEVVAVTVPYQLSPTQAETYSQYGRLYGRTPSKALDRLVDLWKARKGLLIQRHDELCGMLTVLEMCFWGQTGFIAEEGQPSTKFPAPDGGIWEACMAVELPLLLLEMIRDDLFFEQAPVWMQAVLDLNAAITLKWTHRAHPNGCSSKRPFWLSPTQSVVERYFRQIPTVIDLLWAKRDILLGSPSGGSNNPIMLTPMLAPALITYTYAITDLHVYFYPEYFSRLAKLTSAVGLALAAWTQVVVTTGPGYRSPLLMPQHHYYPFIVLVKYRECIFKPTRAGLTMRQRDDVWRLTIDMIMEGVGPVGFMRACHDALSSWPNIHGTNLKDLLEALQHITNFLNHSNFEKPKDLASPVRHAHWNLPMLPAIVQALERESCSGIGSHTPVVIAHIRARICYSSLLLVQFTQHGLEFNQGPIVMDGRSVYKIFSLCLHMLSRSVEYQRDQDNTRTRESEIKVAVASFGNISDSWAYMCTDGILTANRAQAAVMIRLLQETKLAAAESWYDDLCALRSHRELLGGNDGYQRLVQSWIAFGKSFGLKETVERDLHDAQSKHVCSWVMCKFYLEPSPTPLSTCKGCGEQKYCSRECQKSDWKQGGHRSKCRRLNL